MEIARRIRVKEAYYCKLVQKRFRGMQARRFLRIFLRELVRLRDIRSAAAYRVQRLYRGHVARKVRSVGPRRPDPLDGGTSPARWPPADRALPRRFGALLAAARITSAQSSCAPSNGICHGRRQVVEKLLVAKFKGALLADHLKRRRDHNEAVANKDLRIKLLNRSPDQALPCSPLSRLLTKPHDSGIPKSGQRSGRPASRASCTRARRVETRSEMLARHFI